MLLTLAWVSRRVLIFQHCVCIDYLEVLFYKRNLINKSSMYSYSLCFWKHLPNIFKTNFFGLFLFCFLLICSNFYVDYLVLKQGECTVMSLFKSDFFVHFQNNMTLLSSSIMIKCKEDFKRQHQHVSKTKCWYLSRKVYFSIQ